MRKRKDRLYTHYRNCPICGGKNIYVWKKKKILFKENTYIYCGKCKKNIQIKEE